MSSLQTVAEHMEEIRSLNKKNNAAKKAGTWLFPIFICSLVAIPMMVMKFGIRPLVIFFAGPIVAVTSLAILFVQKKLWKKRSQLLEKSFHDEVLEALGLKNLRATNQDVEQTS